MKILIDLLHPAHLHFFKNLIWEMQKKGHEFIILSRDKDCLLELLDEYGFKHICLSRQKKGMHHLALELGIRLIKTLNIIRKEKPDVLVGCMGAVIAPAGFMTRTPSYVFYENESAKLTNKYVYRLCTRFITPENYKDKVPEDKHITYNGFQQLAFLHPKYFKTVVPQRHFLIRTVSKESSHDKGMQGIKNLERIKSILSTFGTVYISSEKQKSKFKASKFHKLISGSRLVIAESPTVCAEAACLGVPSLYISKSKRGFIDELESKYGLVYQVEEKDITEDAIINILSHDYKKRYDGLIKENKELTSWMIGFLELNQKS